jgi:hypothetical protein
LIEGFWCEAGLSEHAVHFWVTSRDTYVERNVIRDCARGIGFGLGASGNGQERVYEDDPCPGADYLGHIDGVIENNFVWAGRAELFDSEYGFDSGIALEQACGAVARHNSIASLEPPFVSIEYRWPNTDARIEHNLTTHGIVPRDGATAALALNLPDASLDNFVDAASGDLHLAEDAPAVGGGVPIEGSTTHDIDGEVRDSTPDIGADEVVW